MMFQSDWVVVISRQILASWVASEQEDRDIWCGTGPASNAAARSGIGDTKSNNNDGAISGSGVDGDVVNITMKKRDDGGQRI
jgi:hypothetical protein